MNYRCNNEGFTLMNLITTLSILMVVISSVVPGLKRTLANQDLTATSNQILGGIILARSEAIKTNDRITMLSEDGNWTQGWSIFIDRNNNGLRESDESLLLENTALSPGLSLKGNNPVKSYVSYVGNGQAERTSGAIQMGTLMLCDQDNDMARAIIISSSGRARISKESKDFKSCT